VFELPFERWELDRKMMGAQPRDTGKLIYSTIVAC